MKQKTLALLAVVLCSGMFLMQSCKKDQCQVKHNIIEYKFEKISNEALRSSVTVTGPQDLIQTGKIYMTGNYALINDVDRGIHVIDNTDPSNPQKVSFVHIPGNVDMSVKGGVLYADSYVDLVAIDISNPASPSELGRLENVFPQRVPQGVDEELIDDAHGAIIGWTEETKTIKEGIDCNEFVENSQNQQWQRNNGFFDDATGPQAGVTVLAESDAASFNSTGTDRNNTNTGVNKGGSTARFTVIGDYLYTVDDHSLHLFDLSNPAAPFEFAEANLGQGIETIFPYEDKLFIGANDGMHIYDNSVPSNPTYISTYQHITTCDPVVVQDDIAYVTLRTGNTCWIGGNTNALDIIDLSNIENPTLISSFWMSNPHGLSIDEDVLFICDGWDGLKTYTVPDPFGFNQEVADQIQGFTAYDVISYNDLLMVTTDRGFYQFDYDQSGNLTELSVIPMQ